MAYEAHIAGLPDDTPIARAVNLLRRALKRARDPGRRRAPRARSRPSRADGMPPAARQRGRHGHRSRVPPPTPPSPRSPPARASSRRTSSTTSRGLTLEPACCFALPVVRASDPASSPARAAASSPPAPPAPTASRSRGCRPASAHRRRGRRRGPDAAPHRARRATARARRPRLLPPRQGGRARRARERGRARRRATASSSAPAPTGVRGRAGREWRLPSCMLRSRARHVAQWWRAKCPHVTRRTAHP